MFKFGISTSILFSITIIVCSSFCLALVMTQEKGNWPEAWPKELEPYRKQAKTIQIATGNQESVYEIRFKNREEFEKAWPIILNLKSKGAPLRLLSIEKASKKDGTKVFTNEQPAVRVYCPPYDSGTIRSLGMCGAEPLWPESAMLPTGQIPEYVTKLKDSQILVPVGENTPRDFMTRARIELELVVDGQIIDLNRIRLPADSLIIDKRKEPDDIDIREDLQNHSEWISEFLRRSKSIKAGATRGELLKVFTTEGGISARTWRTYVYKQCPYIKVDVEFKAEDDDKHENAYDIITKISKPYLEWSIMD